MRSHVVPFLALGLVPTALSGCGDDDDIARGLSQERADAVAGIYRIDSFEGSELGCGPAEDRRAQLSDDSLAVVPQSFFGLTQVVVLSCEGAVNCNETASRLRDMNTFTFGDFTTILSSTEGDALTGEVVSSGFLIDGMCQMASVSPTRLERNAGALSIEYRVFAVEPFPPEDGICFTSGAEESERGECTVFRRVTATWERPLP